MYRLTLKLLSQTGWKTRVESLIDIILLSNFQHNFSSVL